MLAHMAIPGALVAPLRHAPAGEVVRRAVPRKEGTQAPDLAGGRPQDVASVERPVGALLPAILREWQVGSRSSSQEPLHKTQGPEQPMRPSPLRCTRSPLFRTAVRPAKGDTPFAPLAEAHTLWLCSSHRRFPQYHDAVLNAAVSFLRT